MELHRRPQWHRSHASPPTQHSVLWPHRKLGRRHQWHCSNASPPPTTALRGPSGSPTEGSSGAVRM
eukprot:6409602-Pyramimonas_sp.AAC.1